MNGSQGLPRPRDDWAFFLDVDGTLVEIAARPSAVVVSCETISLLQDLARRLAGAVALVSGRTLADLDRLFAPLRLPAAGLHGLERRTASGSIVRTSVAVEALEGAREALHSLARLPGVLIEDKAASLAVHYRQAPDREAEVVTAVGDIADRSGGGLTLLRGKMVAELRPPGPDKGDVVAAFMMEAPFAGRVPVFIGDDVTDEDGFRAAERLGGFAIRIGAPGVGAARYCFDDVAELRRFLNEAAQGTAHA